MHMATSNKPWTRAELERFPVDGNRYEVLDGELLVTPLPGGPHQRVAIRLGGLLSAYCDRHRIGSGAAPGPVPHGENELQPDIAIFLDPSVPFEAAWERYPRASLVVEILSPSTQHRDRGVKRDAYLRWGIPEYWIVDTENREVTTVRPGRDDERVVDSIHWQPRDNLPALQIALTELFR